MGIQAGRQNINFSKQIRYKYERVGLDPKKKETRWRQYRPTTVIPMIGGTIFDRRADG